MHSPNTSKPLQPVLLGRLRAWLAMAPLLLAGATAAGAPPKELTIAVATTPVSLPLFVADSQGYFADEGLKPRLQECVGGFRCMQLMFAGEADLATAADAPIMFNSFDRADFAVLGTFVIAHDETKLVARKSAGITKPQQLSGKRVGAVLRSSSHYFLDAYLLMNGVEPKSVTTLGLAPDALVDALASGQVDAIAVWEPQGWQAMNRLKGDAALLPSSGVYNETFNLVASRRVIGARDAELTKVLRAIERATRFIRTRPAEAQAVLRARLRMDQDTVDWLWQGLHFRLSLDQGLLRTLEAEARWALREGHVRPGKVPNFLNYVHGSPLRAVNESAVGLPQ
jgi:ABC-type nitrate/sulfonate/bicarbonate transport system substrate-binding protein